MNDDALTRAEELVLRSVDGALSPSEQRELEQLAQEDPSLEATLTAHRELSLGLDSLGARLRADADLEPKPSNPWDKTVRRLGFALFFGGAALVLGAALGPALIALGSSPLGIGLSALGLGTALLLTRLVVLRVRRPDPYEVIER